MESCHSNNNNNKKKQFGNSYVTDDVITLDATWEDILWEKNVKVIKLFKKNASKDSGSSFLS